MNRLRSSSVILRTVAVSFALLIALPASFAQTPEYPPSETPDTQQTVALLAPEQLDNMVAPIALYPDPLLSQVLAASTYPLGIVEAQQWLEQNRNLQGSQLMDAAKRQNWDPSVQALVAFPEAMELLANDVQWTTGLGNAFLAQQADVMSAVQRMRVRAKANGRLNSTPQQVVTMDNQDGQSAIEIQPADPEIVYVPVYSPTYIWGPPAWGGYYDPWYASGFGFRFGRGIYMSSYFPGWGGWSGWGWSFGWSGRGMFLNTGFFPRYGYRASYYGVSGHGFGGRGFGGRVGWAHNPSHRMGVPYANRAMASRYNSNRFSSGRSGARMNGGQFTGGARVNAGQWQRFSDGNRAASARQSGTRGFAPSGASRVQSGNRGDAGTYRQRSPNSGSGGRSQDYRSAPSYNRSAGPGYSAPRQDSSAPRSYSAPRSSGGGSGYFGGRFGGDSRSSGGRISSSDGRAGGGGGHRR